MASKCPHCQGTNIEVEPVRGDAICTSCGTVLSEHNIVSEVQFLDNAKGGSSAVGQFVSSDSIGKRSGFTRSFTGVFSKDSKEITLARARKSIRMLSQRLRLSDHCIDISYNFFKLALSKGITKGRKSELITGACVYMTCRTECTAHMLIDVSDALRVDVYELGRSFLRLSTALCISMPAIDPCLYIWRFAHKLSFGEETHRVSETALRLVKRMKKDWMHTGRRPSGVCGAALIIASRFHDFNRTICDVINVVKVHESTLRKRLTEFGETPSSALKLDEFMNIDLEEEQDPPALRLGKKKEQKRVQSLLEQEDLDSEFNKLQNLIEKQLSETKKKLRGRWAKYAKSPKKVTKRMEDDEADEFIAESTLQSIDEIINDSSSELVTQSVPRGIGPSAASLGLKDTIEECMKVTKSTEPRITGSEELDLTGIDEEEIDSYIMSDIEISFKTDLWMDLNKDYLEEVRLKEERLKEEEERRLREGIPEKKKKVYKKKVKNSTPANTAGEAIEKMLQEKKLSNKINYDVLRNLNSTPEGSENSSTVEKTLENDSAYDSVETPEEINSALDSLAKKHGIDVENSENVKKRTAEEMCSTSYDDYADMDDDEEMEDETEESLAEILRKRRGEELNYHEDYDDYD